MLHYWTLTDIRLAVKAHQLNVFIDPLTPFLALFILEIKFMFSLGDLPSMTGPPLQPQTAPQMGSQSLGSFGQKSPWPPVNSLRCSSEIAHTH